MFEQSFIALSFIKIFLEIGFGMVADCHWWSDGHHAMGNPIRLQIPDVAQSNAESATSSHGSSPVSRDCAWYGANLRAPSSNYIHIVGQHFSIERAGTKLRVMVRARLDTPS